MKNEATKSTGTPLQSIVRLAAVLLDNVISQDVGGKTAINKLKAN